MSNPYDGKQNPYNAPTPGYNPSFPPQHPQPPMGGPSSTGKVVAPAIALLMIAGLGLAASLFNVGFALLGESTVDPNAPEWIQEMERGSVGINVALIQGAFAIFNLVIIAGAVQMLRIKSRGMGIAASIMSMINIGTFCCVLGMPVGIWALVILMQDDVKRLFESRA